MDSRIDLLADKLVVAAVIWLPIGLIATAVFANQNDQLLNAVGRIFHLVNISTASALAIKIGRINGILLVLLSASLFFVDKIYGYRIPYIVSLNILFMITGIIISSRYWKITKKVVVFSTVVSGVVMLLQLIGVGEWTQFFTTHGNLPNGTSLTKSPFPTLFVDAAELQANHLQGRPAGLFYSNQFASLVVLFAVALSMTAGGRRYFWVDIMLCATAVLTLAKVVILGICVVISILLIWGDQKHRWVAIRYLCLILFLLFIYKMLFPGVFEQNILSERSAWISIIIRISDILNVTIGINYGDIVDALGKIDPDSRIFHLAKSNLSSISAIVDAQGGKPISAFAHIAQYFWHIAILAFCIACFLTINSAARIRISKWLQNGIGIRGFSIFAIICSFSLAANFLSSQFFWFIVGFGLPSISHGGQGARGAARTSGQKADI